MSRIWARKSKLWDQLSLNYGMENLNSEIKKDKIQDKKGINIKFWDKSQCYKKKLNLRE